MKNCENSKESRNCVFTCCKHLDFSDNYNAVKNFISSGNTTKVVWVRQSPDDIELVQFCKKRGRINSPEGCLDKEHSWCSDYTEVEMSVPIDFPIDFRKENIKWKN